MENTLKIIKETTNTGKVWFWVEYNGTRVSPIYNEKEEDLAHLFFENYSYIEHKLETIKERTI